MSLAALSVKVKGKEEIRMNAIDLCSDLTARKSKLAVVGLGYVGLPLAVQFAKHYDVIGFDTNEKKVARYKAGVDVTGEAGDAALKETDCQFTAQEEALKDARFLSSLSQPHSMGTIHRT